MEQHQEAQDLRLEKIEQWITGGFAPDGKPIPGLLRTVEQLAIQAADLKTWIIRLGTAVALGVFTNAVITLLHYVGVLPAAAATTKP